MPMSAAGGGRTSGGTRLAVAIEQSWYSPYCLWTSTVRAAAASPRRRRCRCTRLLIVAALAWLAFVASHHVTSGRWWLVAVSWGAVPPPGRGLGPLLHPAAWATSRSVGAFGRSEQIPI